VSINAAVDSNVAAVADLQSAQTTEEAARKEQGLSLSRQLAAEVTRLRDSTSSGLANEVTRATAAEDLLASNVLSLEGAHGDVAASHGDQLDAHGAALSELTEVTKGQAALLESSIVGERGRATAEETALREALEKLREDAAAATAGALDDLSAEVVRSTAADDKHGSAIAGLESSGDKNKAAIAGVATDVAMEATRAAAAETALEGRLADEEARATATGAANDKAISNEKNRASRRETELAQSITSLESANKLELSSVGQKVVLEQQRAERTEDTLRNAILAMQSSHAVDDKDHADQIGDLVTITKGQAVTLEKEVGAERTRAQAVEEALEQAQKDSASALGKRVDAEVSRAEKREDDIEDQVVAETSRATSVAEKNAASVRTETSRALAAEGLLKQVRPLTPMHACMHACMYTQNRATTRSMSFAFPLLRV